MLPIALRPGGRHAVIVGGGIVAARKAESIAAAGFPILVVAPEIDASLRAMLSAGAGAYAARNYEASDLDGAALVIAATSDEEINARVIADAQEKGILACDASNGQRGTFTMPAVLRTSGLTVSVDSSGAAPAFSSRLVRDLEKIFTPEYGLAAETLGRMRAYARQTLSRDERSAVLQTLAELPIQSLASMTPADAQREVEAAASQLRTHEAAPRILAKVTCASRGSALALAQSREIAARLAERGVATAILSIATTGDAVQDRPIERLGGTGVFVKELEVAVRDRRADYAVHSCKDLPADLPADLRIAAISRREDARDAFCSERYAAFDALPSGAVVGTSSPRRRAALAAIRPDLNYRDVRGNVDTRLRKLREGTYDAIVLAMAGLKRLGLQATHTVAFAPETIVPAVGQGALAVQTRVGDDWLAGLLRETVNDRCSELCVSCERATLSALRAGCTTPVGIYAQLQNDTMTVDGFFAAGDLPRRARTSANVTTLEAARRLGVQLASLLAAPLAGRVVVLPRTQRRASRIAEALRELGAQVVELRAGDAGPDPAEAIPDMLLFASSGAVTAARPYLERLQASARKPLVAAIGKHSARAALDAGFPADAVADDASVEALVALARQRLERRAGPK
jgi:hydroxymethylbilane synthase